MMFHMKESFYSTLLYHSIKSGVKLPPAYIVLICLIFSCDASLSEKSSPHPPPQVLFKLYILSPGSLPLVTCVQPGVNMCNKRDGGRFSALNFQSSHNSPPITDSGCDDLGTLAYFISKCVLQFALSNEGPKIFQGYGDVSVFRSKVVSHTQGVLPALLLVGDARMPSKVLR